MSGRERKGNPSREVLACPKIEGYKCVVADGYAGDYVRVIRESDGQVVGWGRVKAGFRLTATWDQWEEEIMGFLKKVAAKDRAKMKSPSGEGKAWADKYPALWEYLTRTEYEGGAARTTATLNLSLSEGLIKAALNDRDNERTLWVSGPSIPEVLAALEELLASDKGEWRVNKPWTPGKAQKRS